MARFALPLPVTRSTLGMRAASSRMVSELSPTIPFTMPEPLLVFSTHYSTPPFWAPAGDTGGVPAGAPSASADVEGVAKGVADEEDRHNREGDDAPRGGGQDRVADDVIFGPGHEIASVGISSGRSKPSHDSGPGRKRDMTGARCRACGIKVGVGFLTPTLNRIGLCDDCQRSVEHGVLREHDGQIEWWNPALLIQRDGRGRRGIMAHWTVTQAPRQRGAHPRDA